MSKAIQAPIDRPNYFVRVAHSEHLKRGLATAAAGLIVGALLELVPQQ